MADYQSFFYFLQVHSPRKGCDLIVIKVDSLENIEDQKINSVAFLFPDTHKEHYEMFRRGNYPDKNLLFIFAGESQVPVVYAIEKTQACSQ